MAFTQLLDEMREMHLKKGADYGRTADPYANVRASEDFGVPGWVGCMIRANDKMRRIQKFAQTGVLENESVRDSLLDLAVYAVIGLDLYDEEVARRRPEGPTRLERILSARRVITSWDSRDEGELERRYMD